MLMLSRYRGFQHNQRASTSSGATCEPMKDVEDFTIFIKNSIRFPSFNYTKGNFLPSITKEYIKKCNFHKVTDIYCPIFKVGDILKDAEQNFTQLANTVQIVVFFKVSN
ncbi:hypothetical protein AMECASPLE_037715 [Ameca splendens]|uniref:Uncharacterized protein n=1 Tax=Ameca splendens TaxID=208324 RepID=A0ABV0YJU3_9TELE